MAGSGKTWRREQAIAALLSASTMADAARGAGVSERTLTRWLRDPDFAADCAAARRQALELAVAALQQATSEAVATLRRNLTEGPPAVQVRAAAEILSQAAKWEELHALADRVTALEDGATAGAMG